MQIHTATKYLAQFFSQHDELNVSNSRLWFELHQHINVAVWTEIRAQHRAEQRQLTDVMPLAKAADRLLNIGKVYVLRIHAKTFFSLQIIILSAVYVSSIATFDLLSITQNADLPENQKVGICATATSHRVLES